MNRSLMSILLGGALAQKKKVVPAPAATTKTPQGQTTQFAPNQDFEKLLDAKPIEKSGLFDKKWYFEQYPEVAEIYINPVMHYLETGWKQGYNPSPRFDTNKYLSTYPDVADAKICPLVHYIRFGYGEGRLPKLDVKYVKKLKESRSWSEKI